MSFGNCSFVDQDSCRIAAGTHSLLLNSCCRPPKPPPSYQSIKTQLHKKFSEMSYQMHKVSIHSAVTYEFRFVSKPREYQQQQLLFATNTVWTPGVYSRHANGIQGTLECTPGTTAGASRITDFINWDTEFVVTICLPCRNYNCSSMNTSTPHRSFPKIPWLSQLPQRMFKLAAFWKFSCYPS